MFSLPPTPTALPPAAPAPVILPDNLSLWDSSGEVIGLWNYFGSYTPAVQILLLAGIIIAATFAIMAIVHTLSGDESDQKRNLRVVVRQQFPRRRRR